MSCEELLQLLVGCKLYGAIWYNPQAVDSVPSHIPSEPLFLPHANKASPYAFILGRRVSRLDLLDDFQPFQRTNDRSRGSTCNAAGNEVGSDFRGEKGQKRVRRPLR